MADNLIASISVDSSKARADLKLFNAEISKTSAALKEAVKAGDPAAVSAQHQALQGLYQERAKTTAVIKQNTAATRESTQANRTHTLSLKEAGIEFGHLAHAAGLTIPGLKALRAGFAAFTAVEIVRGITAAIDAMNELNIAAKEAGTTVGTIKGLQNAFRAAGDDAAKAAPLLANFAKAARESRLRPGEVDRRAAEAAAQVMAQPGGLQADAQEAAAKVRREAAARRPGPSEDPFGYFGIDTARYEQTIEGQRKLQQDTAAAVLKKKKDQPGMIDQTEIAALKLYQQELAVVEPELQKIAKGGFEFPEPSAENKQALDEYNGLLAGLVVAWDQVTAAAGRAVAALALAKTERSAASPVMDSGTPYDPSGPRFASGGYVGGGSGLARVSNGEFVVNAGSVSRLGVGYLQGLNRFAEGGLVGGDGGAITTEEHNKQLRQIAEGMAKAFTDAWEGVQRVFRSLEEALVQVSKGMLKLGEPQGADPRQATYGAARYEGARYEAARYEGARYEAATYGAAYMGGNASGGYIRGPGSGTSDSILARLSNGEFVINAGATRRLGTSFLNGLNSFAAGGLVNVPPIRFAEGGLVPGFAAGGQAMASFHFESGSSFRLGGPVDVVNAMVTEAHAQQVRSAGVKPSWYAARPSGR
jgi:hypothetical protein